MVKTIPDTVDMSQFGFPGHPGITHGAPVEAAFTPDAKYAYVSNYSMYGTGFGPEGNDNCTPSSAEAAGDTNSYVYRINTSTLEIDQVIEVGLVPKYLAVSPNAKWLLVANWCSYDLSIVNIAEAKEVARLPMGAYPRGIAISPDSSTAYVAIMGGYDVVKVDLNTLTEVGSFYVGYNPRQRGHRPRGPVPVRLFERRLATASRSTSPTTRSSPRSTPETPTAPCPSRPTDCPSTSSTTSPTP